MVDLAFASVSGPWMTPTHSSLAYGLTLKYAASRVQQILLRLVQMTQVGSSRQLGRDCNLSLCEISLRRSRNYRCERYSYMYGCIIRRSGRDRARITVNFSHPSLLH
jgi:hypothetical protein